MFVSSLEHIAIYKYAIQMLTVGNFHILSFSLDILL